MDNKIRQFRKQSGLSLEQFAERLNTSIGTVQKLERGRQNLTHKWMREIAAALGCATADLLPDEDVPYRLDEVEMQIVTTFRKLNLPGQNRYLKVMSALAEPVVGGRDHPSRSNTASQQEP